jgi:hypothetical protein
MSYRYQLTISDEANEILERLMEIGIYGRSVPEIMKRMIDRQLQGFVKLPYKRLNRGRLEDEEQP